MVFERRVQDFDSRGQTYQLITDTPIGNQLISCIFVRNVSGTNPSLTCTIQNVDPGSHLPISTLLTHTAILADSTVPNVAYWDETATQKNTGLVLVTYTITGTNPSFDVLHTVLCSEGHSITGNTVTNGNPVNTTMFLLQLPGNGTFSNNKDMIIKTMVVTTDNNGGARQLLLNATSKPLSTKTVGTLTTGDLLDREIAIPANTVLTIGGQAADALLMTYIQIST